jgi:hypothetical protein
MLKEPPATVEDCWHEAERLREQAETATTKYMRERLLSLAEQYEMLVRDWAKFPRRHARR